MAGNTFELKYPIIVINTDRTERKTYMTHANLEEAIEKANKFGCHGSIMLHDEDGSEICDDEILEYYLQRKAKFMICNSCRDWTPHDPVISVEKERKLLAQNQAPKVITKLYSHPRNLKLHRSNELTSTERIPVILNSTVTSTDNSEESKIFRNGVDCLYSEFADFAIPWDKIPLDILELLESGKPLLRKFNTLANLLVDELLLLKPTIPLPIMRRVSERVVARYPQSFSAFGADKNLSELSDAFLGVLKNRYFNITRGNIKAHKGARKSIKPKGSSVSDNNYELNIAQNQDHDIDIKIEHDSMSSFE